MRLSRAWLIAPVLGACVSLCVVSCSADGGAPVPDPTGDTLPADPAPPGAVLPPQGDAAPADRGDASKPDAAREGGAADAATDAARDAGPPAPTPGTPCAQINEVAQRMCGACGTQETLCLANAEGGGGRWTDYGACAGEIPGGCIPGTNDVAACGNCGTQTRSCNQYCLWNTTACVEPPNACKAGTVELSGAGCPTPNTFRTKTCSQTCVWSFSLTCEAPNNPNKLTIATAVDGVVSGSFPLVDTQLGPRVSGTCPTATVSSTKNHAFQLVELFNPDAVAHTVDCWLDGPTPIDTVMTWYASNVPPNDDAARKACGGGSVNDFCPAVLGCSDGDWSGLTGTAAPVVPAGGRVLVWYGSYYGHPGASPTVGDVTLSCKTK